MSTHSSQAPHISVEKLKVYLSRRKTDLEALEIALNSGTYPVISEIAHRIKGSARTYGFPVFETICSELEEGALEQNRSKLEAQVEAFRAHLLFQLTSHP